MTGSRARPVSRDTISFEFSRLWSARRRLHMHAASVWNAQSVHSVVVKIPGERLELPATRIAARFFAPVEGRRIQSLADDRFPAGLILAARTSQPTRRSDQNGLPAMNPYSYA